jgi:lysophospholipase L1-like esterase
MSRLRLTAAALALLALAGSAGTSSAQQGGLYVALGDSISAGNGASSLGKSWVQLYYGYLQSNGSGVTDLRNLSRAGATSTDLRTRQLGPAVAAISTSSDTKAVTIDIGINDFPIPCVTANAPTCPLAGDLRATLTALNAVLAADPGDETVQLMEYYNSYVGRLDESTMRQVLLGSDGKVDCGGAGAALGLNDLIHCISIEHGAKPIDVLPIFDTGGAALIAPDHIHPNDAGHLAIATAFGGAAAPTGPPPPPPVSAPTLKAGKLTLSRAAAGKPFTASMLVSNADTGVPARGLVTCQGKLSGKSLRATRHSSSSSGRSSCTWLMPAAAHNKQFTGSITLSYHGSKVSRSFSTNVK